MDLRLQKKLAAALLKVSKSNVKLDTNSLKDIKEAITKADVRGLIAKGLIKPKKVKGQSKYRTRKLKKQKNKGKRKGHGSRKGKKTARVPKKTKWILKIRAQRKFIKMLMEKNLITKKTYRAIYRKAGGGFFRNKKHIENYLKDNSLLENKK